MAIGICAVRTRARLPRRGAGVVPPGRLAGHPDGTATARSPAAEWEMRDRGESHLSPALRWDLGTDRGPRRKASCRSPWTGIRLDRLHPIADTPTVYPEAPRQFRHRDVPLQTGRRHHSLPPSVHARTDSAPSAKPAERPVVPSSTSQTRNFLLPRTLKIRDICRRRHVRAACLSRPAGNYAAFPRRG